MSDTLKLGFAIVFFVAMMGLKVWWGVYKYQDCLRVGHSKTYCSLDFGK